MLQISKIETLLYKNKVMRNSKEISVNQIYELNNQIILKKPDVCRLKISGDDENLTSELNNLGYPYEIQNVIIRNRLKIPNLENIETKTFSYKEVIDENNLDFQKVLSDVVDNKTWVEYESDLTLNLFPKEKRKEIAKKYYSKFNSSSDPKSYTALFYKEKEPIGFFMGTFVDNVFLGSFFGVIDKYRSQNYARHMYYFMFEVCKKKNIEYFETEVNISNFQSLKSSYSKGFKPASIKFNINIFTFYEFENKKAVELNNKEISNLNSILVYLNENYNSLEITNIKKKVNTTTITTNKTIKIEAFKNELNSMFVFHFLKDDTICLSYYINLSKKG
jgi:hypothetical protein